MIEILNGENLKLIGLNILKSGEEANYKIMIILKIKILNFL